MLRNNHHRNNHETPPVYFYVPVNDLNKLHLDYRQDGRMLRGASLQLWTCYKIILFDLADEVYDEVEDFGGDGLAYLAIFGGFAGDGMLHEVVESRHQPRVGIRDE